jgi:hypothetical protein
VAAEIDISGSPSGGVGVRDPYIIKGGGQRSLTPLFPGARKDMLIPRDE